MHPQNLPLLLLEVVRQGSCPVWAMPRVGSDWDVQPSAARWREGGLASQSNTIPTCFRRTREVCTSVLKQAQIMMWLVLKHAILALPLAGTVTETHGQHCHIRPSSKYLKNIFPLIMEEMMPPDRAGHFRSVWEGQVVQEQAPSPGPSLLSCRYSICIALKKQDSQNSNWQAQSPHQEERAEKIHTRDIEEVLEVPPSCYHGWPRP